MDYISANLPAIQLDETRDFYSALGFQCTYFSAEWMILEQGSLKLEFFHHPELEPHASWHSACIRVQDLTALYHTWREVNWSLFPQARITEIQSLAEIDLFCVIDINGSLLRCIQHN
ncbi:bleomycin resistance protein [Acinetobacter albensis]|uniref:Bleomycin resistance protein n=1 Tax=Acinetobacter albensis TaxID=1673609 RepID=A0ABW9JQE9_9GAMM|nr:bleomycin resistance protein [Acinetobacter sp. TTH0-4]QPF38670.1 hypothetical protein H0S58_03980 [Acinetobacter sp. TTH0-4]